MRPMNLYLPMRIKANAVSFLKRIKEKRKEKKKKLMQFQLTYKQLGKLTYKQ
jgi:hypothetical protein